MAMAQFVLRLDHFIRAISFIAIVALRYLSRRYPLSDLQEALAEGIIVGHEGLEMPQFQFSPRMIDALLAYMNSVQAK
jgi:hypothetical protein